MALLNVLFTLFGIQHKIKLILTLKHIWNHSSKKKKEMYMLKILLNSIKTTI